MSSRGLGSGLLPHETAIRRNLEALAARADYRSPNIGHPTARPWGNATRPGAELGHEAPIDNAVEKPPLAYESPSTFNLSTRGVPGRGMPVSAGVSLAKQSPTEFQQVQHVQPAVSSSQPMNAGTGPKSVFEFPCPYEDCTFGYPTAKKLRRHKKETHDYCATCDLDFEDDIALIGHRIESTLQDEGKHIACLVCGQDFGSEAGREAHFKLVSIAQQSSHRTVLNSVADPSLQTRDFLPWVQSMLRPWLYDGLTCLEQRMP